MPIWATTSLTASNPNASPVITSIAFNLSDTRSLSNPASQSDPNFQRRLGRALAPPSCRTCSAHEKKRLAVKRGAPVPSSDDPYWTVNLNVLVTVVAPDVPPTVMV